MKPNTTKIYFIVADAYLGNKVTTIRAKKHTEYTEYVFSADCGNCFRNTYPLFSSIFLWCYILFYYYYFIT